MVVSIRSDACAGWRRRRRCTPNPEITSTPLTSSRRNPMQTRKKKKKKKLNFSGRMWSIYKSDTFTNLRNGWKISAGLYLQRFFPAKKICKWIPKRWGFYSVLESWKRMKGCIVRGRCQRNKEAPRDTLRDHARVCTLYTHKGVWSAARLLFVVWLCVSRSDRCVRDRFEASRKRGGVLCV